MACWDLEFAHDSILTVILEDRDADILNYSEMDRLIALKVEREKTFTDFNYLEKFFLSLNIELTKQIRILEPSLSICMALDKSPKKSPENTVLSRNAIFQPQMLFVYHTVSPVKCPIPALTIRSTTSNSSIDRGA